VESSDDECDKNTEETVMQEDVNGLPVSECDGSLSVNQWSCKVPPEQSVVTKEVESKGKQMCHTGEPSNHDCTDTIASIGKAISRPVSLVTAELPLLNASKESTNALNPCISKGEEPPLKENQSYNRDVTDRGGELLLLGKTDHLEENRTDVSSFQLESQLNHCGTKTTQECVLPSIKYTSTVDEQVQDNEGHVETNSHPMQPGNCKVIESPSVTLTQSRLGEPYTGPPQSNRNSRFGNQLINLDYKLGNPVESISKKTIIEEPQPTSNTAKTKADQTQDKCYAIETVNGKQFSVASDIEFEDEISVLENLQSSTSSQALPVSDQLEAVKANGGIASSLGKFSKRSRYSKRISKQSQGDGFQTKTVNGKRISVVSYIEHEDDVSTPESSQRSTTLRRLLLSETSKVAEDVPHYAVNDRGRPTTASLFSDRCDRRFRFRGELRRHTLTHADDLPFSCRICHQSLKSELYLLKHSTIHKEEECREGLICNICKKEFSQGYDLKKHMTTHTTDKNVEQKDTAGSSDETSKGVPQYTTDKNVEQKDTAGSSDEVSNGVPQSSPHHTTNDNGAPSSTFSNMKSIDTSRLPPGSALVSDRGVFRTNDKDRPFACGYCGNNYLSIQGVDANITQHHDQNVSLSCELCGKFFVHQYHLSRHLKSHNQKRPFAYNLRGKRNHVKGGLVNTLVKSNNLKHSRDTKIISNRSQGDDQNRRFSCQSCGRRFGRQYHLSRHMAAVHKQNEAGSLLSSELPPDSTMLAHYGVFRTKDKEKPFMCGYCVTSYNSYHAACSHVEMKHGEKRYSCEFCGRRYAHQCHLALHITITHTREKIFTCDQCDCRFRFQRQLRRHTLIHTKDLPFSCSICQKSFKSESYLLKHSEMHNEEERREGVISYTCKKEFSHDYHLKEHMTTHSTDKSVEQKDTAGSSDEKSRGALESSTHHIANAHGRPSSIVSNMESIGTLKLPPGSTLVSDRGVFHTKDKERPFACGYCGKNYLSKQGVDAHITQHHDQNVSLSCEFCGKFFAHQYHLSRHVKSHTGKDPSACNKYILKDHMIIHSGERPFKCSCCDKDFRVEMHLRFHMITHIENGKLLVGESHDPEEIKISEVIQLQQPALSSNNCSALVEHLPYNANLVESNSHPSQLEDNQTQMKASIPKAPSGFGTTNSRSLRSRTNGRLQTSLKSSSDNLYNKVSAERKLPVMKESQISNTVETSSNESKGKSRPSNSVNGRRISLAACIAFEDDLSSRDSLQCSTTTQTLFSEVPKNHPPLSSRQFVNGGGKSSSVRVPVENTVSSNPPPGAVLLRYRHIFYAKGKEKPFLCGYCGKAYKIKHSAYGHVKHNHEEKRYSCEFCGKRYSQQCSLASHMIIHTQEKPFACDQCGKQFRYRSGLRNHKYTHSAERLFPCEKCSKAFKTREVLIVHRETHQKVEDRTGVICNICKKRLTTSYSLKLHMRTHTGEKPFKCTLCDKQFLQKLGLQYHMNTHNGKKRHEDKLCSLCGKSVTANYMPIHMRMHSGEKPFECSICFKRFPKKINLEGHMRSHTGEKPFACSGCDKRFALYSNMVTHKAKCLAVSENVA